MRVENIEVGKYQYKLNEKIEETGVEKDIGGAIG